MLITCPVHGETEGYDTQGGYRGKCRLCTRERVKAYKAAVKAAGGVPSKRPLLGTPNPHPVLMQCPVHGLTEAYQCESLKGGCIACNREHQQEYRAKVKLNPKPVVVPSDPWLTCNQPECRKVCVDRHELYVHKTETHGNGAPVEPRSLMPSQLGQR